MEGQELEPADLDTEFAFETDHLALKGNKDYCELLKYIVKLEAQKVQALKQIEDLSEAHSNAMADPLSFVKDLQEGTINFPPRPVVADLPEVDWNAYGIDSSLETDEFTNSVRTSDSDACMKVRGRVFTDSKPDTFNQLWSCEEQKRLEELLEIYPEETFESRRYKKIAKALGTRTPLQVMSRIQKYFAKLAQAGLPIPGRIPRKIKEKTSSIFYKKSTFFPQLQVPVKMEDSYEDNDVHNVAYKSEHKGGESAMLELLRAAKEQRLLDERSPVWQTNTVCVGCQKSRFLGAKWTDNAGTDYCTDCVVKLLPSERLIPVRH